MKLQPSDLNILLESKYSHLKINDEYGFTEEYRMSVKSIIDLIIDIQDFNSKNQKENNFDFYCDKCKGISRGSKHCENHSCPNMPCCEKPREFCDCK